MIIAHAGLLLYFFNGVTLAAYLVILVPSIILRIFIEEKCFLKLKVIQILQRREKDCSRQYGNKEKSATHAIHADPHSTGDWSPRWAEDRHDHQ